jgi:hypothetical protein
LSLTVASYEITLAKGVVRCPYGLTTRDERQIERHPVLMITCNWTVASHGNISGVNVGKEDIPI